MKKFEATPTHLHRFKILCLLAAGACIPLLVGVLENLFVAKVRPVSKVEYGIYAAQLSLIVATLLFAYRFVRHQKQPGVAAIGLYMGGLVVMVALTHLL